MGMPNILMALPPTLCEKCGQEVVSLVASVDSGITQILHHCPHNHTLAHATLDEVDGKRAIIKWVFEGPVLSPKLPFVKRDFQ